MYASMSSICCSVSTLPKPSILFRPMRMISPTRASFAGMPLMGQILLLENAFQARTFAGLETNMEHGNGRSIRHRCGVRRPVAGSGPIRRHFSCARLRIPHIKWREDLYSTARNERRHSFPGIDRSFDNAVDDFIDTLARKAEVVRQNSERDLFPFRGDSVSGKSFNAAQ